MTSLLRHTFCFVTATLLLLAACTPSPSHPQASDELPPMYPDYTDVTIPCNIAPLNFLVRDDHCEAVQVEARHCDLMPEYEEETAITLLNKGNEAIFDIDEWKKLIHHVGNIEVKVTALINGTWMEYKPFFWHVTDSIDSHLTYRLIEPDYEIYQNLTLQERCLENFDERSISNYGLVGNRCMNCHTYANRQPGLSMLYVRGEGGGAILNRNGQLTKLNIKTDGMVSGSVYFGFSKSGRYITFSTNVIIPAFHAMPSKRLEVFDRTSDVYVADLETNTIISSALLSDSLAFETFPTFSPDGKYIYFCTAPHVNLPVELKEMRYSLCRIAFDEQTGTIGETVDTLFSGQRRGKSVCHPRVSPDGRHIVYTVADYGTFPIWHPEADLEMMDLATGQTDEMKVVNSGKSDTYHSWSSNSRWLVFASKRDDGLFGKPYFCYIDRQGRAHKPFVLPQRDPAHYDNCLKSFNAPELGRGRLPFSADDVRRAVEGPAINMK